MGVLARIGKCRRPIGWTAFALILAGLGGALHAWLPPAPRWVRDWTFNDIVFHPDGSHVVASSSGDDDAGSRVQLWDVESGRVLASYGNRTGRIFAEACSPDGRFWAGAIEQARETPPRLQVFDLQSGEEHGLALELLDEEIYPRNLKFSPDGNTIAVRTIPSKRAPDRPPEPTRQGSALLFDAATGKPLARLPQFGQSHFTADGRFFLHTHLADDLEQLGVWDVTAQRALKPLKPFGLLYWPSPDSKNVASEESFSDKGALLSVWDLSTGSRRVLGEKRKLCHFTFSPDGRLLVVVTPGEKAPAEIWEVQHGPKRRDTQIGKHAFSFFAPDSRHFALATTHEDGQKRMSMVDAETVRVLWDRARFDELCHDTYFTADGSAIVFADFTAMRFEIREVRSGATRADIALAGENPGKWSMRALGYSMQGPFMLAHGQPQNEEQGAAAPGFLERLRDWLPEWLVGRGPAGPPDLLAVIDTRDGRVLFQVRDATFKDAIGYFNFARLSPDGRSLLTAHVEGEGAVLRCYDVPGRRQWRWIIGIPLICAVVLMLTSIGRRRLRRSAVIAAVGRGGVATQAASPTGESP